MARVADVQCAGNCGKLLWRSASSLPAGQAKCQDCRKQQWKHGTANGYGKHACRCVECKAWNTAAHRAFRAKREAQGYQHADCTVPGCDKPAKALGKCSTCYNQMKQNRYRKVATKCACCGTMFLKEQRGERYAASYCSTLCYSYSRWGALSKPLPARHPARGRTPKQPPHPRRENRAAQCAWCGEAFATCQPQAKFCSRICKGKASKAERRAREAGAIGTYAWIDVVKLWAIFDRCCAYCDTPTPLDQIQAEHVVPISRNGSNNVGNILPRCGPCNSEKRDLTLAEWAEFRRTNRVGQHQIRTHWSTEDPRFAHLSPLPPGFLAALDPVGSR